MSRDEAVEALAAAPIFQQIVDDTGTLESYPEVAALVLATLRADGWVLMREDEPTPVQVELIRQYAEGMAQLRQENARLLARPPVLDDEAKDPATPPEGSGSIWPPEHPHEAVR